MQTTINISLDVPQSYQLDTLKQELTEYAKKLVAKAKPKAKVARRQYAHDALCGGLGDVYKRQIQMGT